MFTFKDSVAFLASQLCRNRQQMMSFAKLESRMDADPDPVIDTNEKPETSLESYKITHGKANASTAPGPLLLWKTSLHVLLEGKCFHLDSRATSVLCRMASTQWSR